MCKHLRNGLVILILTIAAVGASNGAATAQSVSAADQLSLAGPWHGMWTASGFRYEAVMTLNVAANGDAEGAINWTLRVSPRANEASKIGMKGTEYIRGKYYPDSATFALDGYRKDDPNVILGLDKYRLVVSETRKSMGGITWHHGPWTGQFFLTH
jgi:hypothetical protein